MPLELGDSVGVYESTGSRQCQRRGSNAILDEKILVRCCIAAHRFDMSTGSHSSSRSERFPSFHDCQRSGPRLHRRGDVALEVRAASSCAQTRALDARCVAPEHSLSRTHLGLPPSRSERARARGVDPRRSPRRDRGHALELDRRCARSRADSSRRCREARVRPDVYVRELRRESGEFERARGRPRVCKRRRRKRRRHRHSRRHGRRKDPPAARDRSAAGRARSPRRRPLPPRRAVVTRSGECDLDREPWGVPRPSAGLEHAPARRCSGAVRPRRHAGGAVRRPSPH